MEQLTIEIIIGSHPFFALLSPDEVKSLAQLFKEKHVKLGEIITNEGDMIDYVYLIGSGFAEVRRESISKIYKGEVKVARLGKGEGIGLIETGLFSKTGFRSASVYALTDMLLFQINISDLTQFIKSTNRYAHFTKSTADILKIHLLKQVTAFKKLSNEAVSYLLKNIKSISYLAGEYVFHEGEKGTDCYLIEKGKIDIRRLDKESKTEKTICTLNPGMMFGEMAVLTHAVHRNASAVANDDCQLLALNKKIILNVLQENHVIDAMIEFLTLNIEPKINPDVQLIATTHHDGSEIFALKNKITNEILYLDSLEKELWEELNTHQTLNTILNRYSKKFNKEESQSLKSFLLKLIKIDFIKSSSVPVIYKKIPFYKNWVMNIKKLFRH